ncbi:MAG TPA: hypothetical protein VNK43_03760 [Gemmatimonadales bacterium]|nr:hypothetical protein [Gemmatimonadales bacterium]
MTEIWDRLLSGASELAYILPALLLAAVILLAGYFLARTLQRGVDRALQRVNFNRVADDAGLTEVVSRAHIDPVHAVGKLVFWLVMLAVILLASSALGLESINTMFGAMVSFLPTLIAAVVIVILGMLVGEFLRGLILASAGGVEGVPTLAKLAKGGVVLVALFLALQQLGVSEEIVTSAFTLVFGAIALAAGIAFGLGNRRLAGEITRKWYEEGRRRDRRITDRPEYQAAQAKAQADMIRAAVREAIREARKEEPTLLD